MLCADLVHLEWRDTCGSTQRTVANLEDISLTGACLQVDDPIPLQTTVTINHPKGDLTGLIRYCVYRDIGYFLGVEFEPDSRWSREDFSPQHLFDPRRLAVQSAVEESRTAARN
jgi:hypothetical protein